MFDSLGLLRHGELRVAESVQDAPMQLRFAGMSYAMLSSVLW
jgi:hypothetical protein